MVDDKVEMNNEADNYTAVATNDPKNVQELTQYVSTFNITCKRSVNAFNLFKIKKFKLQVQTLLQSFQDKFQTMSDQILNRIDEMGNRIDDLEKNIADLMTQAGVEGPDK